MGLVPNIWLFMPVTARLASSGVEKQTKPKPCQVGMRVVVVVVMVGGFGGCVTGGGWGAADLGVGLLIGHDLHGGDGAVGGEGGLELLFVDGVVEVLDEEVDALILSLLLGAAGLELLAEVGLAL